MKRIKMMIYGEPGVGKSVFACHLPKPFFITTDGNYEWLEEFGAKEKDHLRVECWDDFKKALNNDYDEYETIVVDLIEDLFKWCEKEFCDTNRLTHVSDLGYGKGYDITRNDFFIEMCKLINKDKHIVFISHETVVVVKDRRGVEHTTYRPSDSIPAKLLDKIEGRLRYVVRAYLKAEEVNEKLYKRRYLSIIPKENEYGIIRGLNENNLPTDIPLDADEFLKTIGLNEIRETLKEPKKVKKVVEEVVPEVEKEVIEETPIIETIPAPLEPEESVKEETEKEEPKADQPLTNEDKLSAIKAKLAALKAQRGE